MYKAHQRALRGVYYTYEECWFYDFEFFWTQVFIFVLLEEIEECYRVMDWICE